MAGWVKSPTAALWQSNSKSQGLADWQLSGNRYGIFGHRALISRDRDGLLASELRRKFLSGMYDVQDDVGVVTNLNEDNIW